LALLARRGGAKQLSAFDAFAVGAASKAVATITTYPLVRGKTLLLTRPKEFPSLAVATAAVLSKEGPAGLFRGLEAALAKTVLASALMLAVKERAFGAAFVSISTLRGRRK